MSEESLLTECVCRADIKVWLRYDVTLTESLLCPYMELPGVINIWEAT